MSATSAAGGSTNNGYTGPGKGLVLVFDMDNTIIDTHEGLMHAILDPAVSPEGKERLIATALNSKLVEEVLRPAAQLRDSGSGKVDAIFLLTNNSDRDYIFAVSSYLSRTLGSKGVFQTVRAKPKVGDIEFPDLSSADSGYFFDYIMVRYHHSRSGDNPSKRMVDVKFMMNALQKPINDLERRTFFFDDMIPRHAIQRDLSAKGYGSNYIFIKGHDWDGSGGFIKGTTDPTDFSSVIAAFQNGVPLATPTTAATYVPSEGENEAEKEERDQRERNKSFVEAAKAARVTKAKASLASLFAPTQSKGGYKRTRKNGKGKQKNKHRYKKTIRRRH